MKQRGRRSAASLLVVPAAVEQIPRQRPPAELTREQAAIWNAIVRAEPADWFPAPTRPVLVQYCRHIVAARRAAEMIKALEASIAEMSAVDGANQFAITLSASEEFDRLLKMQERESRVIASLATKMRITQQATTNHRGNRIESKKLWEF
jgi:hypothetical protein